MHRKLIRILAGVATTTVCVVGTNVASADEISLRAGESADVHAVYWVSNCRSILKSFAGVDVVEGPPGVTLSIREEDVYARRQNCSEKIPGGIVVVTAKDVPAKISSTLKYRVRYNTEDGLKQSNHSVQLTLSP